MAAAQIAGRSLSAVVKFSCQADAGQECNRSSRSSLSLSSRRSSIPRGTISCNLSNSGTSKVAAGLASGSTVLRAVAEEKAVETAATSRKTEYHFLVASSKFMLDEEEHFQELMRERLRHFGEQSKEQDFWLVIEPDFLEKFPDVTERLRRPAVALVSTDALWITFMKLRLDRVLEGAYEADTLAEALAGGNWNTKIEFEKPEKWTAPYRKYEPDWWLTFLPPRA